MNKEEIFEGFSVHDLMELWHSLQSEEGASADVSDEMMTALSNYLRQAKPANSVFAAEHARKKPLF